MVTFSGKSPGEELIDEVVVTNPAACERGQVPIGDDGAFTWEFFGDLDEAEAGRILDEVTNALRSTGVQLPQEQGHGADLIGTAEQQLVYLNTHWAAPIAFRLRAGRMTRRRRRRGLARKMSLRIRLRPACGQNARSLPDE